MTAVVRRACMAALAMLTALLVPLQASANALVPSDRWIASVTAPQPLLSYRLGLVDLEGGGSPLAAELPTAARIALKKAGYFAAEGDRLHVAIAVRSLGGNGAEVEYTVRRGMPGQPGQVLHRETVKTATDNPSMTTEDTELRLLAGNLKLFVIGLRTRFDPAFAPAATRLAQAAREDVNSRDVLSYIGEGAAKTLVATVEGTGAVLGAVGEVASSPEFYNAVNQVSNEYGRQQQESYQRAADQRAQMAEMQASAARERELRAANERASARQRQAEQAAAQAERLAAQAQQTRSRQDAQAAAAAQRKREADERLARQEAERAAKIARQEREARENAARQMRGFVASSNAAQGSKGTSGAANTARTGAGLQMVDAGEARVGADPVPVAKKVSRGQARAWCRVTKGGEYWCNGPLQNGGWGTLKGALAMVDCPNGHGYTPTYGTGGQSFDCGRELRETEQEMPLYDPFYKYGKPNP